MSSTNDDGSTHAVQRPRVFLSFLACEAREEARALQRALATCCGLTVFCDPHRHLDTGKADRAKADIQEADLIVILGTKMYGQRTTAVFDTHDELRFIFEARKRVLAVSMCSRYKYKRTQHLMPLVAHTTVTWREHCAGLAPHAQHAGVKPPTCLVDTIAASAKDNARMRGSIVTYGADQTQPRGTGGCDDQQQHHDHDHDVNHYERGGHLLSPDASTKCRARRAVLEAATRGLSEESSADDFFPQRRARTGSPSSHAEGIATIEDDIDAKLSAIAVNAGDAQALASAFGVLVSHMLKRGPTLVVSRLLANQSCVEAIFVAMRAHLDHTLLQHCGLYILKHAINVMAPSSPRDMELPASEPPRRCHKPSPSVDSGVPSNPLPRVMEEGAALAVLLMNMHTGDDTLQKHGVQIVELVTNHGLEGRAHALEVGADAAVATAMRTCKRSSRIQTRGSAALNNINHHKKKEALS